jgi:hypothetical protein
MLSESLGRGKHEHGIEGQFQSRSLTERETRQPVLTWVACFPSPLDEVSMSTASKVSSNRGPGSSEKPDNLDLCYAN